MTAIIAITFENDKLCLYRMKLCTVKKLRLIVSSIIKINFIYWIGAPGYLIFELIIKNKKGFIWKKKEMK